ncbi:hypothetical protein G6F64_014790 [Rhizopus arrhizus]|uniref:Uncharacterized protein n=1 Tax=Rhizopus oryzae TaxID=64495 RepID=A0A9P6WSX9_RHIOR|nr:hypothetical protein G6F64_014790 [Rhizopus arrhizus]
MCAIPVAFQPQLLRQVAELVVTLEMQQVGGLEIGVLLDPVAESVPRGHGRQAQAGIELGVPEATVSRGAVGDPHRAAPSR